MREFQKNIVNSDLNILVAIQPKLKSKPKCQWLKGLQMESHLHPPILQKEQ